MEESKRAAVRSTVKAIILHEGKVLLNRCRDPWNGGLRFASRGRAGAV